MDEIKEVPWFDDGLKFKCTGCGQCCTGSDGYVFLSNLDIRNLSEHLSLPENQFKQKYTRSVNGEYALLDQPKSGDCIFLKDNKCSAYEARPVQCRTFPWWVHNLRGPEEWEAAGAHCEGINHPDAPVILGSHIEQQCLSHLGNLLEKSFS
jgi:Fe-S-cluster containining protein